MFMLFNDCKCIIFDLLNVKIWIIKKWVITIVYVLRDYLFKIIWNCLFKSGFHVYVI